MFFQSRILTIRRHFYEFQAHLNDKISAKRALAESILGVRKRTLPESELLVLKRRVVSDSHSVHGAAQDPHRWSQGGRQVHRMHGNELISPENYRDSYPSSAVRYKSRSPTSSPSTRTDSEVRSATNLRSACGSSSWRREKQTSNSGMCRATRSTSPSPVAEIEVPKLTNMKTVAAMKLAGQPS
ncbi:unnamed protein product [Phytophthora fragariaefolia]|uniref:Unnamed protein product n=1 Tax=Phytophthora fragariaefolia TaxID=1490495 RepID=A0A9W6U606_9STRA|nr:unnamed protein product [Phytophthora fragariaefolia]